MSETVSKIVTEPDHAILSKYLVCLPHLSNPLFAFIPLSLSLQWYFTGSCDTDLAESVQSRVVFAKSNLVRISSLIPGPDLPRGVRRGGCLISAHPNTQATTYPVAMPVQESGCSRLLRSVGLQGHSVVHNSTRGGGDVRERRGEDRPNRYQSTATTVLKVVRPSASLCCKGIISKWYMDMHGFDISATCEFRSRALGLVPWNPQ